MEPAGSKNVAIKYGGESIEIPLDFDGGKYVSMVYVNGVPCHLEAMPVGQLVTSYHVDDDPDYRPQLDEDGCAFLLVPFSR